MEDVRSIKKKIEQLKSVPSSNMISFEDYIFVYENEGDYEMKRCETLNEGVYIVLTWVLIQVPNRVM